MLSVIAAAFKREQSSDRSVTELLGQAGCLALTLDRGRTQLVVAIPVPAAASNNMTNEVDGHRGRGA